MRRLLKAVLMFVGGDLISDYRRLSLDLLKIKGAGLYVQAVGKARCAWIGLLLFLLLLLILASGFVMLHIGFFLWVPWSDSTKYLVLMGLGALYLLVPIILLIAFSSEKKWMKAAKIDKVLASLASKQTQKQD